jgi:hypothetical protein
LIDSLLSAAPDANHKVPHEAQVRDLLDGGMGGVRFVNMDSRHFGREITRAKYQDSDGIIVGIALSTDDQGDLFELDFWKVNFAPLKRYPAPQDISVVK